MNDSDEQVGLEALESFFHQFGPLDDVYVRVFWEVLLEELYGINSVTDDEKKTD